MAFRGKFPLRSKLEIEDKILEQVSYFHFLGCDVNYEHCEDGIDKNRK